MPPPEPGKSSPGRECPPLSPLLGLTFLSTPFQKRQLVREGLLRAFVHPLRSTKPIPTQQAATTQDAGGITALSIPPQPTPFPRPRPLAPAAVSSWRRDILRDSCPHNLQGPTPHPTPPFLATGHHHPGERALQRSCRSRRHLPATAPVPI